MRPDVDTQLRNANWDDIGKQLLAYTIWRAQNYGWANIYSDELPRGQTLYDIVQIVIEKTLNGTRKWDPDKGLLEPWLRDQVNSELDHLFQSSRKMKETHSLEWEDGEHGSEMLPARARRGNAAETPATASAEEVILDNEEKEIISARVDIIMASVKDEPELEAIMLAVMGGCSVKPQLLAEELGVSEAEIYNRLKRLRRRGLKMKEEIYNDKAQSPDNRRRTVARAKRPIRRDSTRDPRRS